MKPLTKTGSAVKNALHRHFATSHAFVIGINQYTHLTTLKNARNDAQLIADTLAQSIHGYTVHPPLLDATHADIKELIECYFILQGMV